MSRTRGRVVALAFCIPLFLGPASLAQDEELKKSIEELRKGQQDILKELADIKRQIQTPAQPAAPNVAGKVFPIGDNPTKGSDSAKLMLIEFTDYECPFCARYALGTYPQIEKEFVATGKLRYGLIDMPLDFHKLAFKAAEATRCGAEQGKYWEIHDQLFQNQKTLEPWSAHAQAVGLDVEKFDACLASGKYAESIRAGIAIARSAGITGTPGFLLAETDPKDPKKVKGIAVLKGAKPFAEFKAEIEKALAK